MIAPSPLPKRPVSVRRSVKKTEPTQGFGVPITRDPHHFKVIIPRSGRVIIEEYLGWQARGETHAIIRRLSLSLTLWRTIRDVVQHSFNKRLVKRGLATSSWKTGENPVDRLLGKELCVLAWSIELIDPKHIAQVIDSWLALRHEERWWLFGITAQTAGNEDDGNKGWRVALRYALGYTSERIDPINHALRAPDTRRAAKAIHKPRVQRAIPENQPALESVIPTLDIKDTKHHVNNIRQTSEVSAEITLSNQKQTLLTSKPCITLHDKPSSLSDKQKTQSAKQTKSSDKQSERSAKPQQQHLISTAFSVVRTGLTSTAHRQAHGASVTHPTAHRAIQRADGPLQPPDHQQGDWLQKPNQEITEPDLVHSDVNTQPDLF